jgi:hypothetical protein
MTSSHHVKDAHRYIAHAVKSPPPPPTIVAMLHP